MATQNVNALAQMGLNEFLYADIGMESNGMTLHLVSVFARGGADPWTEAGRLARLPKAAAIESLTRTIAGMPNSLWNLADASAIATRLIDLLPAAVVIRATQTATVATGWRPELRTIVIVVAVAVGIAYATMMMMPDSQPIAEDWAGPNTVASSPAATDSGTAPRR